MEKWPRRMPRPLLFFATRRRRKLWHGRWGKCDIFCAVIPLYLQIDALSEIVRRRRNECAPVTQRHTTGTSGISAWQQPVCFESTESCLCYSNIEKVCGYLPQNNGLQRQTAPYAIAAMKTIVPDMTSFFLSFFFFQLKRLKWFSGVFTLLSPCINQIICPLCAIFSWWESVLLYARRSDWLMGGRGSAELTIKGPAVTHNPITSHSTPKPGSRTTTMERFCSFVWQVCISLIDWHHRKSFIKTRISSVINIIVTHKGTRALLFLMAGNQPTSLISWSLKFSIFSFFSTFFWGQISLFFLLLQKWSI